VAKKTGASEAKPGPPSRVRISQAEIPRHSLREALTVAQAITDNFAGHATAPHQIAMALGVSPTSSDWRTLTGAAVAYGLTNGAYNADKIELQDLGRRATAPKEEGDDTKARADAALKPKVFSQFFGKYQRAKFPPDQIARNVLEQDFGVPRDRLEDALTTLKDNGAFVGFIHQTKTGPFVSTDELSPSPVTLPTASAATEPPASEHEDPSASPQSTVRTPAPPLSVVPPGPVPKSEPAAFKVFITHGRDMGIVEQVKDVLDLYDIEYEIAVEEETTAIPVPQKVLAAMRRCVAGIMIVSADDDAAAATGTINNNVLIEIGAAFVLYDQRVVLLWDKRLKVPSNLQGLYRCECEGGQLTFAAGTRLAKAIKGFRK
jgi:hypothetical protein